MSKLCQHKENKQILQFFYTSLWVTVPLNKCVCILMIRYRFIPRRVLADLAVQIMWRTLIRFLHIFSVRRSLANSRSQLTAADVWVCSDQLTCNLDLTAHHIVSQSHWDQCTRLIWVSMCHVSCVTGHAHKYQQTNHKQSRAYLIIKDKKLLFWFTKYKLYKEILTKSYNNKRYILI